MKFKKLRVALSLTMVVFLSLVFFQRHVIASVTIGISDYHEISPNLYLDDLFLAQQRLDIAATLEKAKQRVALKYGVLLSDPTIIVSSTVDKASRYFSDRVFPAATISLPWGQYIPISPEGINIDVMSHELVHAEVFHRLGYLKSAMNLPNWFNEGVALQVDYREGKIWSYIQEGITLPPVSSLDEGLKFSSNDRALYYTAAKVEVSAWLASDKNPDLYAFLTELKDGNTFEESYKLGVNQN